MVSIVIIWVVKKLQNRHHLWEDRGRMKEWQTTIQVTTISSVIRVFNVPRVLQAYVKPKVNLQGHPVTSLHGKIVPSQIVPLNSQIVPQYSQNVSRVFKLRAKQEHHAYRKPLYACKMPDSFSTLATRKQLLLFLTYQTPWGFFQITQTGLSVKRVRLEKQLKKTLTKLSISVLERIKVATLGFRCSNKYSKSVVWSLRKSLQSHKGEFLF